MKEPKKERLTPGMSSSLQERLGPRFAGDPASRMAVWCANGYWRPVDATNMVAECARCDKEPVPGPRRFGIADSVGSALHMAIHYGWNFGQGAVAFRNRITAEAAKGRVLPD